MTGNEVPTCQHCQSPMCAARQCSVETLARGPREQQCAHKYAIAASTQEKRLERAACGSNCRAFVVGCVDGRDTWIASYVRAELRAMSGESFLISRHTADCVASALQDRFLSDTDAILKRILDLAALRCLRDGSSTVTLEDVAVALRSLATVHR